MNFFLTITRSDGAPVRFRPGSQKERDFVREIVARAVSEGVGYFKSEAQVRKAIERAIVATIAEAKGEVAPVTH